MAQEEELQKQSLEQLKNPSCQQCCVWYTVFNNCLGNEQERCDFADEAKGGTETLVKRAKQLPDDLRTHLCERWAKFLAQHTPNKCRCELRMKRFTETYSEELLSHQMDQIDV
jgi:hypothetical protein